MIVTELQDLALFSVASNLWKKTVKSNGEWEVAAKKVIDSIPTIYPHLPTSIESKIIGIVSLMGNELTNLSMAVRQFGNIYPNKSGSLHFDEIRWTPYFTIDRMKTLCSSNDVSLSIEDNEFPSTVKDSWDELNGFVLLKIDNLFGKYKYYIFLHSFCYGESLDLARINRRPPVFVRHETCFFVDHILCFEKFYDPNAYVENVFRYSVISGDIYSVARLYYTLLPIEKRNENVILMANMVIMELPKLEWKLKLSKFKIVATFLFLWHQLDNCDRFDIVQNHFKQYYQFVLSFPGTDTLVRFVNWYRPTNSRKENREYLEKAVVGISKNIAECEKCREVFHLMYNKVETMMSEIDVVNLLETLLSVKDIDSSVLIMKKMDPEKKNKVLDVLHKIWNDLWKDFIDLETFMTFFIEVQSHTIQVVDIEKH